MKTNQGSRLLIAGLLAIGIGPFQTNGAVNTNIGYTQVNLTSDINGVAHQTDPFLLNPWGLVARGVLWVNNNHSGVLSTYGPSGVARPHPIPVPPPPGGANLGTPTGLTFNPTSKFVITNGTKHAASTLLLATEDGTIAAWHATLTRTNAVLVVDHSSSNAIYKGLTIAHDDATGKYRLYAANFHGGMVDVFDEDFHYLSSFTDTNLPTGFAPFNVRAIRGKVFVTFAKQELPDAEDDEPGPGHGYVDIFDTDGTLLRRFAAEGVLNSPWALAIAPRNFGKFSHALLVGNFGDGHINAYDLLTGKLLGHLTDAQGADVVIDGLWGLSFETDEVPEKECMFTAQRLYFTAGVAHEDHGLFGYIHPINPLIR
jgi:uncharacterized protein (TIGR03118 family)